MAGEKGLHLTALSCMFGLSVTAAAIALLHAASDQEHSRSRDDVPGYGGSHGTKNNLERPLSWLKSDHPFGVPLRNPRWNDEERSLLRTFLRPDRQDKHLQAGAGGTLPPRWQPRRSLAFYTRPSECSKPPHTYPNGSYPTSKLLTWRARPDRFLLAVCHYGQLHNQLLCMDKHFLLAALLNRTLIIPPGSFARGELFGWAWDLSIDRAHANACLGRGAILSLDEARARLGTRTVAVNNISCVVTSRTFCNPAAWNVDGLALTLPPGEPTVRSEERMTAARFLELFGGDDSKVVALEDQFVVKITDVPYRPYFPLDTSGCGGQPYLRAHPVIRAAADGFVRTVLGGGNFLAMHFRRGDFYKFWKPTRMWACYWPEIPAVSRALSAHAARRNITRVFVASNAHPAEIDLLRRLLRSAGPPDGGLEVLLLPRLDSLPANVTRPWADKWLKMKLDDDPYAAAIFDKLVCTRAANFIGTGGSTFSDDVYRIRWADGTAKCEDGDFLEFEQRVRAAA